MDRSAGVICDAKSGVSGAGRKPSLANSFCEVTENFAAYAALLPPARSRSPHDFRPGGARVQLYGAAPTDRLGGILETIYVRLLNGAGAERLLDIYEKRYAAEPFIRLYHSWPSTGLHGVARTNYRDIGRTVDAASGRAVIVSAIDNLVKGAAGQAVQNMNLLLSYPETEGLL